MQTDELEFLLDFDAWATERVLDTADQINAEAFAAPAGPGHVAPRSTLLHCISAMRNWRGRLEGTSEFPPATEDAYPTLAAVRALWQAEHALLDAYVAGLDERDLDEMLEPRPGRVLRAERWQFLVHVVLHNMQHRSELAQALTFLSHSPGELGLTAFLHDGFPSQHS